LAYVQRGEVEKESDAHVQCNHTESQIIARLSIKCKLCEIHQVMVMSPSLSFTSRVARGAVEAETFDLGGLNEGQVGMTKNEEGVEAGREGKRATRGPRPSCGGMSSSRSPRHTCLRSGRHDKPLNPCSVIHVAVSRLKACACAFIHTGDGFAFPFFLPKPILAPLACLRHEALLSPTEITAVAC